MKIRRTTIACRIMNFPSSNMMPAPNGDRLQRCRQASAASLGLGECYRDVESSPLPRRFHLAYHATLLAQYAKGEQKED